MFVSPKADESRVTEIAGKATVTVMVPDTIPDADAVIVAVPLTVPDPTVKYAPVLPAPTITADVTVAMLELLLVRLTVWPLAPAADGNRTNTELAPPVRLKDDGWNVIPFVALTAVIVTVAAADALTPLFTINWITYVPTTSATKVGFEAVGSLNVAALLDGREVNDHA